MTPHQNSTSILLYPFAKEPELSAPVQARKIISGVPCLQTVSTRFVVAVDNRPVGHQEMLSLVVQHRKHTINNGRIISGQDFTLPSLKTNHP
ncbi:hypothetical protein GWI33_012476 [Rhynchophorus ferrugineus]|uniref:Uncharacterized protein n=1 Tax=Rhynchophorus ferrugineus TaxID=354439 RepID=A0A834MCG3_RHYFE|nr:hypothetical protein GWI33_012476 [Rhynchophorus ferrugineus]